jgi:hypothetical protein
MDSKFRTDDEAEESQSQVTHLLRFSNYDVVEVRWRVLFRQEGSVKESWRDDT